LRAFTPRDQKAVKAAATTFRQNPKFKTEEVITQLGVGEALVSMLEGKGVPEIVQRTLIRPPDARVGPLTADERNAIIAASSLRGRYETTIDRESAYEMLMKRRGLSPVPGQPGQVPGGQVPQQAGAGGGLLNDILGSVLGTGAPAGKGGRRTASPAEKVLTSAATSAARTIGTQLGRAIMRGMFGNMR